MRDSITVNIVFIHPPILPVAISSKNNVNTLIQAIIKVRNDIKTSDLNLFYEGQLLWNLNETLEYYGVENGVTIFAIKTPVIFYDFLDFGYDYFSRNRKYRKVFQNFV